MSRRNKQTNGKSPYQRSNRAWWSRGPALVFIVIVLLVATGAWITTYTRSLQTTNLQPSQSIDPATSAKTTGASR